MNERFAGLTNALRQIPSASTPDLGDTYGRAAATFLNAVNRFNDERNISFLPGINYARLSREVAERLNDGSNEDVLGLLSEMTNWDTLPVPREPTQLTVLDSRYRLVIGGEDEHFVETSTVVEPVLSSGLNLLERTYRSRFHALAAIDYLGIIKRTMDMLSKDPSARPEEMELAFYEQWGYLFSCHDIGSMFRRYEEIAHVPANSVNSFSALYPKIELKEVEEALREAQNGKSDNVGYSDVQHAIITFRLNHIDLFQNAFLILLDAYQKPIVDGVKGQFGLNYQN